MKIQHNISNKINKMFKPLVLSIGLLSLVVLAANSVLAWGPERPTYTMDTPTDHVVFNSITNQQPYGDERNFFRIKEASAPNNTYVSKMNLEPGKEYQLYVHYHNNAKPSLNGNNFNGPGVAKNSKLRIKQGWTINANETLKVSATISADNASPKEVWDDVYLSSKNNVALRYVPNSATIHSKGKVNGQKLNNDSLFTTGALLGYNALDGIMPGCNEFSGYVTYNIYVDQPNFTLKKEVRISGQKGWNSTVKAQPGQKVDYLLSYANTGTTIQNNVIAKDILPQFVTYVAGSTILTNTVHPKGVKANDGLTDKGINIGNYAGGSNAYVSFSATMPGKDKLICGENKFYNIAQISTANGAKQSRADVIIDNECKKPIEACDLTTKKIVKIDEEGFDTSKYSKNKADCEGTPPPELPRTGPAAMIGTVIALVAIGVGTAYFIRGRQERKNKMATEFGKQISLPKDKLLETHITKSPKDKK